MFEGVYTAIVTPFKNGKLDLDSLEKLIDYNLSNGVDGMVPCGTTGETPTLEESEYNDIIALSVKKLKGRGKVIAGAGANSTKKAIYNTKLVKELGADAALIVTPYYNKPTQRGLELHYETIAREVDIPIVIYNVPGRTGVNILPQTLEKLSRIANIVAVKEASGNLLQMKEIVDLCGRDFDLLSGDDQLFLPVLAIGGRGIISVASNVIPKKMSELYSNFKNGDTEKAGTIFSEIFPLMNALFYETNPIPVKTALHLMGYIQNEFRLPLCKIGDENLERLKEVMEGAGLLKTS